VHELPLVTVIIPCRNEAGFIVDCLDSIVAGDYPTERIEILVVDGMSDDGTRAKVSEYAKTHPVVRMVDNPQRITPAALNVGIRAARGRVIVRADAHLLYLPHYVRCLVTALLESGADNVGGVLVTVPPVDTAVARAIAVAMAHPFGVGNSYYRVGVTEPRWVDTIAFFCCRRELFERIGLFDEDLLRSQDAEFNARLIGQGGRVLLIPDIVAKYYTRATVRQLSRMFFQYGYFKPLVARKVGRVMTLRQVVPALFVAGMGSLALLSPWVPAAALTFVGITAIYGAGALAAAAHAATRHGARSALALPLVFPVLHMSYGVGFLRRTLELTLRPARRSGNAAELPLSR